MSRLQELIDELCPNGVESRPIGSFISRIREKGKQDKTVNQVYVVSNSQGIVKAEEYRENTIHSEDTSNYTIIRPGMFAYNPSRINIGSIGLLKNNEPGLVSPMYVVFSVDQSVMELDYLEYLMECAFVKNKINSYKEEGVRFRFDFDRWGWIEVPVPPIEVQREIVRVLDFFTLLLDELSDELTFRKQQYDEYLSRFLSNENIKNGTEYNLKDLFDFRNGLSKGKEFFGHGIPFIRYTDVYNKRFLHADDVTSLVECSDTERSKLKVRRGDVFFTRTSETAEDVGWSSVMLDDMEDCVFNGFTIKATPKTELVLPEYCAYCFSTKEFRNYVASHCAFTTRASLTGMTIGNYRINIPDLMTQKKIVEILNKFYLIINDINEGIPAEIEARKKQYEYYRDKLLSFRKLGA